jgi:hypothetical protein
MITNILLIIIILILLKLDYNEVKIQNAIASWHNETENGDLKYEVKYDNNVG